MLTNGGNRRKQDKEQRGDIAERFQCFFFFNPVGQATVAVCKPSGTNNSDLRLVGSKKEKQDTEVENKLCPLAKDSKPAEQLKHY